MAITEASFEQICVVNDFSELVAAPFRGVKNASCWRRTLEGDFSEIVAKLSIKEDIQIVEEDELLALQLSEQGDLARQTLFSDLQLLKAFGADPVLNLIQCYERDDENPIFPTDVYSFHVDRSPAPTDTFLCTYHGDASEILPNSLAQQKILVPEISAALQKLYHGPIEGFEAFLTDYFYDLHYQALPGAKPISLGLGHLWRLAVDHPAQLSLPCIHRAPVESTGQRLLLIC